MKGKIIIITSAAIFLIVATVLASTNCFTQGAITGKLYRVENIYEEIWNLVVSEKNGKQTVLTTAIDGSAVDYDLGSFDQVCIPVNDEYKVVLSFYQKELAIWIFANNSACYVYNHETNILYGDQEVSYLIEKFLSLYDSWVEKDSKFNSKNPGNYTFVLCEFPLSHK